LLYSRYKLSEEIAAAIADVVWNDIKTRDIKDVLQIAKLVRNVGYVQDVARTLMKYRPKLMTGNKSIRHLKVDKRAVLGPGPAYQSIKIISDCNKRLNISD
jgi:hypothetical protein